MRSKPGLAGALGAVSATVLPVWAVVKAVRVASLAFTAVGLRSGSGAGAWWCHLVADQAGLAAPRRRAARARARSTAATRRAAAAAAMRVICQPGMPPVISG